jgi:hypothetical protein
MRDNANYSKKENDDLEGTPRYTSSSKLGIGVTEHLFNKSMRDLTSIGAMSQLAKQQNAIREMIKMPISNTLKALSAASIISEMSKQQNALREKYNHIFSFQDAIRELSKSALRDISDNSASSIILGGSAASALARLKYENSGGFNPTSSALNFITSNPNLFNKQVSIFEKLNKHFHEINQLSTPSWLEQISSTKDYSKATALSAFEIISANTLSQIIGEYPDEQNIENPEDELDKMSSLIQENKALKLEIEKLLKKIACPTKSKSLKKQLAELEEPIKQFSHYVHLNLFKCSEKWTLRTTHYFISLVSYLIISIYLSKKLENLFFTDTSPTQTIFNNNEVNIDNRRTINVYGFDNTTLWGLTSKDLKVYRRKSVKTNCIGMVLCETTVRILRKKGEWLFIESVITKFDKKTKEEVEFVSRGWVKKDAIVFE